MGIQGRKIGRGLSIERSMIAALAVAGAGLLVVAFALPVFVHSAGWAYDFTTYFVAAGRTRDGLSPYLPVNLAGPFTQGPQWYVYAPILSTLIIPFTALSLHAASLVWAALSLVFTAAACAVMPVRPPVRVAVFGVTFLSLGFLSNLNLGSINAVLLLALVLAWRWPSGPLSGLAMGLSLSIRPYLAAILGAWALWRRWRPIGWAILGGLLLAALSVAVAGPGAFVDFAHLLGNVRFAGAPHNGALVGVAEALGAPSPLSLAVTAVAIGAAVAALVLARRFGDPELTFAVAVGASLLASPVIWDHYLILLVIPGAYLASRGRAWGLALPLLSWLPWQAYPVVALLGTLAPFVARSTAGRAVREPTITAVQPR